jgi:hypothetical protein
MSAYPPTGLAPDEGTAVKSCSRGDMPPAVRERPDWKDDPELRRWDGSAASSVWEGAFQSMGWRRSSNRLELPSFHLRKTVQRMATPPSEAEMATRMVTMLLEVCAAPVGIWGAEVGPASTSSVTVVVDLIEVVEVEVCCAGGGGVVEASGEGAGVLVGVVDVVVEVVVDVSVGVVDVDVVVEVAVPEVLLDVSVVLDDVVELDVAVPEVAEPVPVVLPVVDDDVPDDVGVDKVTVSEPEALGGIGAAPTAPGRPGSSLPNCGDRFLMMRLRLA